MSTLQMEFMEIIEGLSDDTMRILLEVVKQVVLPLDHKESVGSSSEHQSKPRRMGSRNGQRLIAEGYDIDESNIESISRVFHEVIWDALILCRNLKVDQLLKVK